MTIKGLLEDLNGKIIYEYLDPTRPGLYAKVPDSLDSRLKLYTRFEYTKGLYNHQAECIDLLVAGQHTARFFAASNGAIP